MRKRKKEWTTKNTHLVKREEGKEKPESWMFTVGVWFGLAAVILGLLIIALNNHIVGYDHFIGIPKEWVRSLFD